MSRGVSDADRARVTRLLESLGESPRGAEADVTAAVLRHVRSLPIPRPWGPVVTLRQFGWAAAAAVLLLSAGTLGLGEAIGSHVRLTPTAILEAAHRAGGVLWAIASGLARVVVREATGTASRVPLLSGWFDSTIVQAAWGAALVCAVVFILTIIVVSYETRVRRVRE